MSIRQFEGETWICGWFNRHTGQLTDVQQYSDITSKGEGEKMARECAERMRHIYPTFVGRIEDVTDWESANKCDEMEELPSASLSAYDPRTQATNPVQQKDERIREYLFVLFEAQKAGHEVHKEIETALKQYKTELAV